MSKSGQTSPAKAQPAPAVFSSPHVQKANEYARDVVEGRVLACKLTRKACSRHLKDLSRSKRKAYPFRFDEQKAHRACVFIQKLPHTKGVWARPRRGESNLIVLSPWQLFFVCAVFGWVDKITSLRRFSEVYLEVPRKNGKSILLAAIGLYMMLMDNEFGAEVYSGATTERQALEVFRPARQMVQRTPALQRFFGVEINKKSLTREEDGARFEPLVGNPGDGSSPSCGLVDELHEHVNDVLINMLRSGMGSREQGLLIAITTAGSNMAGPCYILRTDVIKVLDGTVENEHLFGLIYTIDEGDDWRTDEALRKANPNYGVSVFGEYLKKQQQAAIHFAHKQNNFLTKNLNVWVNAATGWMNMEKWRACADENLSIEEFRGQPVWVGNDLSSKIDLASTAFLFKQLRKNPEGEYLTHYYYFGRHYVPKDTAFDGEHPHYEKWVHEEALTAHDGPEIRLTRIRADLERECRKYEVKALAFDPWSALQMQQELQQEFGEDTVVDVPQTADQLSDPMKELQAAVYGGRFHHDSDAVATWAASNVIAFEGIDEKISPRKEKHGRNKIDPISALLTAMNRAYHAPVEPDSVYETRGLLEL